LKSVYRKFTDRVAADAASAAGASPEARAFDWLAGDWRMDDHKVGLAAAPYGIVMLPEGEPFLIHNAAADMWVLVLTDPAAFGILIGLKMVNGAAQFAGDVTIGAQPVRLRQVWRVTGQHTIELTTDRWEDGRWVRWDYALLERITPAN